VSKKLYFWTEQYLFGKRTLLQWCVSLLLLPFSFIWAFGAYLKKITQKQLDFHIIIISIGNLTVGGSGKTPVAIAIAKRLQNSAIVLRGYGRKSAGLYVVSINGNIQTTVEISGDEAMLYAIALPNATVIVSEDRKIGIQKAIELGSKVVILDDAFAKFDIKKFSILLQPSVNYPKLCLPSGAYRLPPNMAKYADDIWIENRDFIRKTKIENETAKMVLVTAIANASRLDKYLPNSVVAKYILPDHSYFNEDELQKLLTKYNATSLLVTQKDFVKMQNFSLPISILNLKIEFNNGALQKLENYLSSFHIALDKIP
jgi:tetraacyldisaccharide 4'-kinase